MTTVFELEKKRIRHSFAQASESYDGLARLQRSVGDALLSRYLGRDSKRQLLDLGCGTGYITHRLSNLYPDENLFALDIAMPMLQLTRSRNRPMKQLQCLCADAENLPIKDQSIDFIISNLAIQWCRNLGDVFADVRRVLSTKGLFVGSTFGPETLKELRQAWATVDDYTHVNDFYNKEQILVFMQQAGFEDISISSEIYVSYYDQVMTLMRELKGLGAHNLNHGRNHNITGKQKLHGMIQAYERKRKQDRIPATYEVIFISGRRKS